MICPITGARIKGVMPCDQVENHLSMEFRFLGNFSLTILSFRRVLTSWKFDTGDFQGQAIVCSVTVKIKTTSLASFQPAA